MNHNLEFKKKGLNFKKAKTPTPRKEPRTIRTTKRFKIDSLYSTFFLILKRFVSKIKIRFFLSSY